MRMEAWREGPGGPGEAVALRRVPLRRRRGIAAITALDGDRRWDGAVLPPAGAPREQRLAFDVVRRGAPARAVPQHANAGANSVTAAPLGSASEPLSPLALMASALGVGIASAEELAAGAGRLLRVDLTEAETVTMIAVGHGTHGPELAVPATPARLGDLARLVAADPATAQRIRLADPDAFAAAVASAAAAPAEGDGGTEGDAARGAFDAEPESPSASGLTAPAAAPDAVRRPALRIVGSRRVEAALATFRTGSAGLGAERTLTRRQAAVLAAAAGALLVALATAPSTTIDLAVCLAAICFVGLAVLRAAAALTGAGIGFSPPAASLVDIDLPVYTLLVPLHREARVVPRLLPALCALDYPVEKLDLKLLLEASDRETIAAVERHPLAQRFDVVVVPRVGPLTKPKALDVGLALARGELVTIYDAEDRPEPDQLRRAAETFAAGGPALACVQARLATDHAGDTWVTAMFALEYAMLFDALLPWLARHRLPFLLGGTSNHFRKAALLAVGGWDAWNVTEDADLAVRLARRGFAATVIASTTFEEAPLEVAAWLKQRSRWYKGWLQTVLVHARDPAGLVRGAGTEGAVALALQLVGALVTVVAYPVSWVLVTGYATGALPFGSDGSFGDDLWLALVLTAFCGGQAAMVLLAVAALRMRPSAIRPTALIWLPVYWWLHALALALAVVDLVRRPHFWAKTEHGRAERRATGRRLGLTNGEGVAADRADAAGAIAAGQSTAGTVRR
jgi:hypothetical protein